jgi:TonB family protein
MRAYPFTLLISILCSPSLAGFYEGKAALERNDVPAAWKEFLAAADIKQILRRIVRPQGLSGAASVTVELRITERGEVANAVLRESSGHDAYDAAVAKAIASAQPLPVMATWINSGASHPVTVRIRLQEQEEPASGRP